MRPSTIASAFFLLACRSEVERREPEQLDPASDSAPAPARTAEEGTPIAVPTDAGAGARYFVLERGGTRARPTIVTKRVARSGTSYSRREYDCAAWMVRYLGHGKTVAAMNESRADPALAPIVVGSIAHYVGEVACSKGRR